MKICFVTDSFPPNIGGAEFVIGKIVEGIKNRGQNYIVITTKSWSKNNFSLELDKSKLIRIPVPGFMRRFWFQIFSIPVVIIKARDCDLIHGTSYGGILPTYIASKILKKPTVITVHEFLGYSWKRILRSRFKVKIFFSIERFFARLSINKFVAVSEATRKSLINIGIHPRNSTLIYNGESNIIENISGNPTALRNAFGFNKDDFVFASYGRIGLTKGINFLIDSIPEVLDKIPNSRFLLVFSEGDRKLTKYVKEGIDRLDSRRIKFFNGLNRQKLFEYLSISNAIIIPSLTEGFGYTTLESCALGKITIATSVGAIPEVIFGNHLLIKSGSSDEIIQGCLKAYDGEVIYREKPEFIWDLTINKYLDLYKTLI